MFDCGNREGRVSYWCDVGDPIRIFRLSSNRSRLTVIRSSFLFINLIVYLPKEDAKM